MKEQNQSWNVVQAALIGRSHVLQGIVCQDKTYSCTDKGVTAFALADGAGSAKLSHYGAQTVVQSICRLLCSEFERFFSESNAGAVRRQILEHLREQLAQCAAEHGCTLRDLWSTLLAVAVCGDRYLLIHIGDGVIGYVRQQQILVATHPDNGEFANQTTFVTAPNAMQAMRLIRGSNPLIEGFVLMSDGCQASLYSKAGKSLSPVLQRLVYRLGITSSEFLQPSIEASLEETISKKTSDDCSLLLAARVCRTYRDLTDEELDDYFELQDPSLKPRTRKQCRRRYVAILDLLGEERSAAELTAHFSMKHWRYFEQKWLRPLLELGYVRRCADNRYIRTVGPVCIPSGGEEKDKEVQS